MTATSVLGPLLAVPVSWGPLPVVLGRDMGVLSLQQAGLEGDWRAWVVLGLAEVEPQAPAGVELPAGLRPTAAAGEMRGAGE